MGVSRRDALGLPVGRLSVRLLLVALVVVFSAGAVCAHWACRQSDATKRSDLLTQTRLAALAINAGRVARLSGSAADLGSPDYERVRVQLSELRDINARCRFTYLLGMRGGDVFFFADSEPADSKDYSPAGQIYTEVPENVRRAFTGSASVTGPYTDRWGSWVTAATPLRRAGAEDVVGVFCMDMDAHDWAREVRADGIAPMLVALLVSTILTFFFILLRRSRAAMRRIAASEATLRESEERYRDLVENSQELICTHDLEGQVLSCNKAASQQTGYPHEVLLRMNIADLIVPEACDGFRAYLDTLRAQGWARGLMLVRTADGDTRYWEFNNTLRTEGVTTPIVRGMAQDITERVLAEKALHAKTEEIERYFLTALDLFCITDTEGQFRQLNAQWKATLGYPLSELEGKYLLDLVHPDDRDVTLQAMARLKAKEPVLNLVNRLRCKDGSYRWLEWRSSPGDGQSVCAAARDVSERKQTEARLQVSEASLQAANAQLNEAQRIAAVGSWTFHPGSQRPEWSDEMFRIFGLDLRNGVPSYPEFRALVHPDDQSRLDEAVQGVLAGGQGYSIVFRIARSDGTERIVHQQCDTVSADGGKTSHILGTSQDITERKRAEDALSKSERRYRLLAENLNDVIWTLNVEGRFTYVSPSVFQLRGFTPEEVMRQSFEEAVCPGSRTALLDGLRRAVEDSQAGVAHGARPFEVEQPRKDGSTVWTDATIRLVPDEEGRTSVVLGISHDITERKRAEEDLRFSNTLLHTQQEASIDGILVVDDSGTIQSVNRRFAELWGVPDELLESRVDAPVLEFVASKMSEPGPFVERIRYLYEHREEMSNEELVLNDGRFFDRYSAPVFGDAGQYYGRVWYFRDITERKQAEEAREKLEGQLRQSQKMEAVGQLAGGVAHDFNNLLQVILGYVDLIQGDLEPDSPKGWSLGEVRKAAERAADLTRQLLAFSRRQVIQPVDLDLNDLVEGVLKMVRRVIGEHIGLRFMPGNCLGTIHADKGQIEQVLMNLCVNARDAMPVGGTLIIETDNIVMGDTYCDEHPWAAEGRYVLLSVTDTGCGMDHATVTQIFEPFFTTKEVGQGTGLGLATVYGTVKQHNGLIHVYSEPGKGTAFKLYFPTVERPAESVVPQIELPVVGGTETILVAEDEALVRNLVTQILMAAGYTVLTASDGEDALRVFAEHADMIDMALLDVVMPALGGREVMERIHILCPRMRFLFSSGYSEDAVHINFVIKEGVHLISKPYRRDDLLRAVRKALDEPCGT